MVNQVSIYTGGILCNGDGPSPGPCDGLDVPVWDNTTAPAVGDVYEYPANSGMYYEIIFVHSGSLTGLQIR